MRLMVTLIFLQAVRDLHKRKLSRLLVYRIIETLARAPKHRDVVGERISSQKFGVNPKPTTLDTLVIPDRTATFQRNT